MSLQGESRRILTVLLWSILMSMIFVGCGPRSAKIYSAETPKLNLQRYFSGKSHGTGVFFDRFGRVRSSFEIDLLGSQRDGYFELAENLRYSNGDKLKRIYIIRQIGDNLFEAETETIKDSFSDSSSNSKKDEGVVGKALIEQYGNTLHWTYKLRQDVGGGSLWTFAFDDWMFLQNDGTILNRAWASKWGIGIGEVFMSVRRGDRPVRD